MWEATFGQETKSGLVGDPDSLGSDLGTHGESLDTQEDTETDSGRFHLISRESDDS